jgi:hypothetical protein
MKKYFILILFFIPFVSVVFVDAVDYPVLELDEDISGVIGKSVDIKLTAFSIYSPITLTVSFTDRNTNGTFLLFNSQVPHYVNDWITVDTSTLIVDSVYDMTIYCSDAMDNERLITQTVIVDVSDPIIEFFYGDKESLGYEMSLLIDYRIVDSNFAHAEVWMEGSKFIRLLNSREGSFEISYLEFQLPSGYNSYLFSLTLIAYDHAGNEAESEIGVRYSDEFQQETLEARIRRNRVTTAVLMSCLGFYILWFMGLFIMGRKAIKNYFYNKYQINEAIF